MGVLFLSVESFFHIGYAFSHGSAVNKLETLKFLLCLVLGWKVGFLPKSGHYNDFFCSVFDFFSSVFWWHHQWCHQNSGEISDWTEHPKACKVKLCNSAVNQRFKNEYWVEQSYGSSDFWQQIVCLMLLNHIGNGNKPMS